jgi:hypothetical protein
MDWVSFAYGLPGYILALILGVHQLNSSRKKVTVNLREYHYLNVDESKSTIDFHLELNITNNSVRPVSIETIKLLWGTGSVTLVNEAFKEPKPKLPINLEDGKREKLFLNLVHFLSWLKYKNVSGKINLQSIVISSEDKEFKSKPLQFDVDFYLGLFQKELVHIQSMFPKDGFKVNTET